METPVLLWSLIKAKWSGLTLGWLQTSQMAVIIANREPCYSRVQGWSGSWFRLPVRKRKTWTVIIKYKSRQGALQKTPCLLEIRGKGSSRKNGGNGFRAIYISFLSLADPNGFLGEGNQKGLSPSHKAVSNTCTPSSSQTTGMLYNFLTLQIFGSAEIAPSEINLGLHLQFWGALQEFVRAQPQTTTTHLILIW